jgi:hypothetical protein
MYSIIFVECCKPDKDDEESWIWKRVSN